MGAYLWMKIDGAIVNTAILTMAYGYLKESKGEDLARIAALSGSIFDITVSLAMPCPHLPSLITAATNGTAIPQAFITSIEKNRKGHIRNYVKVRLENVFITKVDILNDNRFAIVLNYESIEQTYRQT